MFDHQVNNKGRSEVSRRVPSGSSTSAKKSAVLTSLDDLSLIFGGKLLEFVSFYYHEVILLSTYFILFLLQKLPRRLNSRKLKGKPKKDEKRDWDVIREHKRERCVLFCQFS